MKISIVVLMTILLSLVLVPGLHASGTVVFSDNFDTENGGKAALNYTGFANWTVTGGGTVDLIGNGSWDFLPGHGMYVDLDGSTLNAGLMAHVQSLNAGSYVFSFDLAGNQYAGNRNQYPNTGNETVTVSVNNISSTYILPPTQAFTTYSIPFTLSTTGPVTLSFHDDSHDNIGALLDNTKVSSVPLPGAIWLLGSGLAALIGFRRKCGA